MSRKKAKIEHRKHKKKVILSLAIIFIFLWVGVVAVDYAVRDMLGIEDTKVLGFEVRQEEYVVFTLGNIRYIEKEAVEEKIQNIQQQLYTILERIKNVKMSGITDIFFEVTTNYKNSMI
ncbi:MAG: hypothetical protein JJT76_07800 [Clostridiaceae bacterium]|nr:hypothetical protein [Clostridiaceae bacterium]